MPDEGERSEAAIFFDEHPELRDAMNRSKNFPELKRRSSVKIDDEQLYVVKGDTLGDEDELYLDALIRGSNPQTDDSLARKLFLEMEDHPQSLIIERHKQR